jgi:hypothetical protein
LAGGKSTGLWRVVEAGPERRLAHASRLAAPGLTVEPCFRCGGFAELLAIGSGYVAGAERGHVPLCQDCLRLLRPDPDDYWAAAGSSP